MFYFKFKVFIFVCDGFLDLCFFILNMIYFNVENLQDARTNVIILAGTLLPAFRLQLRVRSLLKYISKRTYQRSMIMMQRRNRDVTKNDDDAITRQRNLTTGEKVIDYVSNLDRASLINRYNGEMWNFCIS